MAKEKKEKNDSRSFMKDFRAELKKVVWPTSKQMVNNVVTVVTIVLITAAIVFCLDFVFDGMNQYGINPIKNKNKSNNQNQNIVTVQTDNNNNNDSDTNQSNDADNGGESKTDSNATE